MNLGGGVLFALLLLTPGFMFAAALMRAEADNPIRIAPEAPNSMVLVMLIGVGSVAAHSLWAGACYINASLVANGFAWPGISRHDLYGVIQHAADGDKPLGAGEVFTALISVASLALIVAFIAPPLARTSLGRRIVRPLLYGWCRELLDLITVENGRRARFATAFVLTSVENDGAVVGYEGILESLNLDANKDVTSVVLVEVGRFVVTIVPETSTGIPATVRRNSVQRPLIQRLHLDRTQIKNIAFNIFEVQ